MEEISQKSLPEEIANRIIDAVSRGEFGRGDQLPPQRELAVSLGVSIASLREALQSLSALGLVRMVKGRGTFISERLEGALGRQAALAVMLGDRDLRELLEVRSYLDAAIVELACLRASSSELDAITTILDEMRHAAAIRDARHLEEADVKFHMSLARATHNDLLLQLAQGILEPLRKQVYATSMSSRTVEQHADILNAVKRRNVEDAKAAVATVLRESATALGIHLAS